MSVSSKALWYIESHLSEDLSLEAIAEAAGASRFHLCRAFTGTTGHSPVGYMRGRRLSEAAKMLAGGARDILSVALDAGYGSHEAFTRAFRQHFGLTPEEIRAQGCFNNLKLQEPVRMNGTTTTQLAAPRLITSEALLIFGLGQHYTCQSNAGIPSQWSRFVPHLGHIPGQVGSTTYGVMCDFDEAGNYKYICGVKVTGFPAHPAEFRGVRIPSETYAVFEHREHVSSIKDTFKAIWERGLADAGFQAKDAAFFERYGPQFDGRTGSGGFEIWIPILVKPATL